MMSMQICAHDRYSDPCSRILHWYYQPLMMCIHRETVPLRYIGTGTHRCVDPLSVCVYRPVAEIENEAFVCATVWKTREEPRKPTTMARLRLAAALVRECGLSELDALAAHIENEAFTRAPTGDE